MSYLETSPLKNSTIMLLYSERGEIKLDPPYQRMGGVWTKEKKQLLIDSIFNDYDIPKIYFHVYDRQQKQEHDFSYAVIDGRQRLETIWGFMEGRFVLASDFVFQRDEAINMAGLSYEDIAKEFPRIRIQFDSFVLPVVGVSTDDEDLIEDMFSRLNEAVPLNAAEKRNSIGGDLVEAIRRVSQHRMFLNNVRFGNRRYQHREVAARLLLTEENLRKGRLIDTKKVYLDALARNKKEGATQDVSDLEAAVDTVLDQMAEVFSQNDELLQAQGNMVVYYLLFKVAIERGETDRITRRKLIDFREQLKTNRMRAEENYEDASYELLEYDRLSQQGTNDASNIKERFSILANAMGLSESEL